MDKILVDSIINKLKNCTGKVGFYYKNLITKEELAYQENESFIAASIIKLPIFAQVIKVSSEHRLDLGKEVQIRKEDILPSCGAINLFSSEPRLDLRTICNFMIALSDNTATNIMIRECGIAALNAGFQEMGLMKTRLERPLFDETASMAGKDNYFTPAEIAMLLESLYAERFVSSAVSKDILQTLKMQNINYKIPGLMAERFEVAHKTGEDDGITHDAGIVYCDQPFIIVFASNGTDVGHFENLIRETSLRLTE